MIRLLKKEEQPFLRKLWDEEFSFDDDGYTAFFFEHYFAECQHYVLSHEQIEAVASVCFHELFYRGHFVKTAMILGVVTLREFRRQGKMDVLLHYLLDEVLVSCPLVLIQAYNPQLYAHLGFECAYYRYHYYFAQAIKSEYRELTVDELLAVYDDYCGSKEGFYGRKRADMLLRMGAVRAMAGVFVGNQGAYCEFYPLKKQVECLVYRDEASALALLGALAFVYGELEVYDQDDLLKRGEKLPYTQVKVMDGGQFGAAKPTFMHEYI